MREGKEQTLITMGDFSIDEMDHLIRQASEIEDAGTRIDFLSGGFLNLPYQESTLIGDIKTPEVLIINLKGVDCFTFLDYVEAMRLSHSFTEFKKNLRRIRYKSGNVSFKNRNHFFTDWKENNLNFVSDITVEIGGHRIMRIQKYLNQKAGATSFIQGIPPKKREIVYLPSGAIDQPVLDKLRTGDYVGIYAMSEGLDVTHVGIIIRSIDEVYLRHASSKEFKVIDQNFMTYIADKPGIVVLRPKGPHEG
ncbi:MAG: N-acetylmuramoyl-L-alanine amidase-like domain-containing protein [Nitrospirota bacterium]